MVSLWKSYIIIFNGMMLVAEKDGFQIYFDSNTQMYTVFKDGKFLIDGKYRYSDVKTYVE